MATREDQGDGATRVFFDHSSARRVATDTVIARALTEQYPALELVVVPEAGCGLVPYALAGHAEITPLDDSGDAGLPASLAWESYVPPARRIDGGRGGLGRRLIFARFSYRWRGAEFLVYLADGRDGTNPYPVNSCYYVLASPPDRPCVDALLMEAGFWTNELHDEVWVFDGGWWQKSRELFESVRNASWDSVVLDPAMKKAVIDDHITFFSSRVTYAKLRVPWKRGLLYYGPPGNGKTISIKAMMNTLYNLENPVPTLYVRSLSSYGGPEMALRNIFAKARETAPCYLVFEDLDSIVSDFARSYFLNEVDGLKANDGILMVGSTNHLDRLDPGISRRPSRFDRKYLFPDPDREQRVAYCRFWQHKLRDNKDIEFPDALCDAIADITDRFSFAYMQEAFVAALLAIARRLAAAGGSGGDPAGGRLFSDEDDDGWVGVMAPSGVGSDGRSVRSDEEEEDGVGSDGELDKLVLWVEIKRQVKILREGMDEEGQQEAEVKDGGEEGRRTSPPERRRAVSPPLST